MSVDSRGVLRGQCQACSCDAYDGGDKGLKCVGCGHPPARHMNLTTGPATQSPPRPQISPLTASLPPSFLLSLSLSLFLSLSFPLSFPLTFPLRVQVVPPTTMYYGMTMTSQQMNFSASLTNSATRMCAAPAVCPIPLLPTMPTWWPSEPATTSRRGRTEGERERRRRGGEGRERGRRGGKRKRGEGREKGGQKVRGREGGRRRM